MRLLSSLLLLCVATLSLQARDLSPAEQDRYDHAFTARQKATRSYQAHLVQTVTSPDLRAPQVSEGEIYYQAPDSFLLRYTRPAGDAILLRGGRAYVTKRGQTKVVDVRAGKDAVAASPLMLLQLFQSGGDPFRERFQITMRQEKSDALQVIVTPREAAEMAGRGPLAIYNILRLPSLDLLGVEVRLGPGQTVKYEFSDAKRDSKLDAALFNPPAEKP